MNVPLPLDHVMIETKTPLADAMRVAQQFGLPLAWPLTETPAYSSAGVNFGAVNIEFIDFRVRFGIAHRSYSGLSGLAYRVDDAEATAQALQARGLRTRVGEQAQAHTTITVQEDSLFPTVFLVQYQFDTRGWRERLAQEFEDARGGRFALRGLRHVAVAGAGHDALPQGLFADIVFDAAATRHTLVFESGMPAQQAMEMGKAGGRWDICLRSFGGPRGLDGRETG